MSRTIDPVSSSLDIIYFGVRKKMLWLATTWITYLHIIMLFPFRRRLLFENISCTNHNVIVEPYHILQSHIGHYFFQYFCSKTPNT